MKRWFIFWMMTYLTKLWTAKHMTPKMVTAVIPFRACIAISYPSVRSKGFSIFVNLFSTQFFQIEITQIISNIYIA